MTFKRDYPELAAWIEAAYNDGFKTRSAMEQLIKERNKGEAEGRVMPQQELGLDWYFDTIYTPENYKATKQHVHYTRTSGAVVDYEVKRIRNKTTGRYGFTVYQHGDDDAEAAREYAAKEAAAAKRRKK